MPTPIDAALAEMEAANVLNWSMVNGQPSFDAAREKVRAILRKHFAPASEFLVVKGKQPVLHECEDGWSIFDEDGEMELWSDGKWREDLEHRHFWPTRADAVAFLESVAKEQAQ